MAAPCVEELVRCTLVAAIAEENEMNALFFPISHRESFRIANGIILEG
jgi:hypothetical protein